MLIMPHQAVLAGGTVTNCSNDTQLPSLPASGETLVVTKSKTLSALDVIPRRELLVADGTYDFFQAVLRLIDDPEQ